MSTGETRKRVLRRVARKAARKYGVDPDVFLRQIAKESGFVEGLSSPAGARGVAQFIPGTAKAYDVDLDDGRSTDDLEGAARYMRDNLKRTGGNYKQALSIYNSGRPEGYKSISETANYVHDILEGRDPPPAGKTKPTPRHVQRSTKTVTTSPGVDKSEERKQLLAQYLLERGNPDALGALRVGLEQAQDVAPTTKVVTRRKSTADASADRTAARSNSAVAKIEREADRIDAAKVPYQWGGGHGARQIRGSKVTPLDCSGAVSRALGLDPRVSGEFAKWGNPGRGKSVTIYANAEHVLMEVNGRFWGTSKTNPGGGAGWIPRSAVSKEYLSRFTARHPPGQ